MFIVPLIKKRKFEEPLYYIPQKRRVNFIHNSTEYSTSEILSFPRYGGFMDYLRDQFVDVYQPPVKFLKKNPETVIVVRYNTQSDDVYFVVESIKEYSKRILNADWCAQQ